MKKIIVPVDFSEYSEYALETAALLAKKHNAELLALHMLEMSSALLTKVDSEQQAKSIFFLRLAEQKFEDFLDKDYLKGIKVTPIVKHFKVFSEVNDVANEHEADLIIMGSQGSSGLKEVLIGSNTEKVVRYSKCPVLVVKHKPEELKLNTAVFASDFSEEAITAYLNARKLANSLGTKLALLYVNLPNDSFRSSDEIEIKVSRFIKKADGNSDNLSDVHYISDYTVEQGVLNFANKNDIDFIAMPTHGRKGIAHFFEGSITENVANHAMLPVMTFKM